MCCQRPWRILEHLLILHGNGLPKSIMTWWHGNAFNVMYYWPFMGIRTALHEVSVSSNLLCKSQIWQWNCRSLRSLSTLLQLYLHSRLNTSLQWVGQGQLQDESGNIKVFGLGTSYIRGVTVVRGFGLNLKMALTWKCNWENGKKKLYHFVPWSAGTRYTHGIIPLGTDADYIIK